MTIYVAICDDNIADRKQTERLLEREKDARLKANSDVLYIDSFGSEEALMHTPIKYDIFFIDMTASANNGMEIAKMLRNKGIIAPIVLCTSAVDYSLYGNIPDNTTIINKPLISGKLSHHIDTAFDWSKNKVPLFEIRCQKETYFVKYTDIIKATKKGPFITEVATINGDFLEMHEPISAFIRLSKSYNSFIPCGKNEVINIHHIISASGNCINLSNGLSVTYSFIHQKEILNAMANCIKTLTTN